MAKAVEELYYGINFDWDKSVFASFDKSMGAAIKSFAAVTAAATAASAAMFGIGKNAADYADNLDKVSRRMNVSTQDVERLTFVAQKNGAAYEDVASSLSALSMAQYDVLRGKGDFEAWGRIGINPSDYESTADLLLAISDGIQQIDSNAERINIMQRLGISNNLLQTLENGKKGITSIYDEFDSLGVTTSKAQIAQADRFQAAWNQATTISSGAFRKVGYNLLESITPALEQFSKFATKNMPQFITAMNSAFSVIGRISEAVFSVINRVSGTFSDFVTVMGGIEPTLKFLGVAFAAFNAKAIIAMTPAILTVGLLYLAFDELVSFLSGKESFIGDFFGKFGVSADEAKKAMSELTKIFSETIVPNGLNAIVSVLGEISKLIIMSIKGYQELYKLFTGENVLTLNADQIRKRVDASSPILSESQLNPVAPAVQNKFEVNITSAATTNAGFVEDMEKGFDEYFSKKSVRIGGE